MESNLKKQIKAKQIIFNAFIKAINYSDILCSFKSYYKSGDLEQKKQSINIIFKSYLGAHDLESAFYYYELKKKS